MSSHVVIKTNQVKKIYNCCSCNKEMDIPLEECLACSNEFTQKMLVVSKREKDPSASAERVKLSLPDDLIRDIKQYYNHLSQEIY